MKAETFLEVLAAVELAGHGGDVAAPDTPPRLTDAGAFTVGARMRA